MALKISDKTCKTDMLQVILR